MSGLTSGAVEEWMDSHKESMQEIFLKKADTVLINKWLLVHGYSAVCDGVTHSTKRGSLTGGNSNPSSPRDLRCGDGFFENAHQRSNSKKYLRQDFAKSKKKNIFRTYEPTSSPELTTEGRRSSLKDMRMFRSLPQNSVNILSLLIQSKVRLPRYPSKDIDMKRDLRQINERDFFLEIVKDISNDLDLRSLTNKIKSNISVLVDGDAGSVFVLEGKGSNRPVLVSKLFDIHSGTSIFPSTSGQSSIKVAWGKGIIGHVAAQGDTVNILDASMDPRYNDEVDRITGYVTESIICMPIRNSDNEIVGVAQVVNKTGSCEGFSEDDEKMLTTYLTFCGIAIHNAQIFEAYSKEYERNKALLEVIHDLFEEQTSVENVIHKIMQRAQSLLKCERCSVLLRDGTSETNFNQVFDLGYPVKNGKSSNYNPENSSDMKFGNKIAEHVLITGETINISDAEHDGRFEHEVDKCGNISMRSILCKPIRNRDSQTIGVAQVMNKSDGLAFDEHDDQLFEAFTIFCGLGINNCVLYEETAILLSKQAVTLETLSYHAGVSATDVVRLKGQKVPEAPVWNLDNHRFNDFSLTKDEMLVAAIRMFEDLGFIRKFKIDIEVLCRWLLTVRKNYRNVSYHNWRHAFNVCQTMFASLKRSGVKRHLEDRETLALVVGCLCHDLDHRGTNNAFQQKSGSALAHLYGTSGTMEHHHFNHAVTILNSEGNNIFANFTSEEYSGTINLLKESILATDLSLHIQLRNKFFAMVDSGQNTWDDRESKETLRSILMTSCDIASITKPWQIQRKAADLVMAEFFDQGDKEKHQLNIQPQACMDRERQDELPKLQMGWIDGICLPLYTALSKMDAYFEPLKDGVLANRGYWEKMDADKLAKDIVRETGV
ncbi:dual 3',5'-cyclic-AMP and -GMP phosphodiesterase 11A-like isoform X2 [Mizuhopecten yessoensis]|uniref:dual 3',5'-cyclic-AMP and -GMP phosphodiesterase 11A-like isoform X2 n=1 Tax=Mizuhopecten yessoensis TaxID=6573 RepID=UPI000B45B3F6|nr:dual 3',5'-cyclic-AMP and -GMP phosphodiesterase 11A-like isoform X2 [Mizuhopecten yessoensis]